MRIRRGVGRDDQPLGGIAPKLRHRGFNVSNFANGGLDHPYIKLFGRISCRIKQSQMARTIRVDHDSNTRSCRSDYLEQLEQRRTDALLQHCEASEVATRMCQALHEAVPNRIGTPNKYDGDRPGRLVQRSDG